MFSIADIQSAEEEPEYEQEEGEGAEDQPLHSYPIRASFSITKVLFHIDVSSLFRTHYDCSAYRRTAKGP